MNIWRMHLRTGGGDVSEFCFGKRVVALGWPVESEFASNDKYLAAYRQKYGARKKGAVEAFASDVNEKDDLLWVRKGMTFFLGRLGPWQVSGDQEYANQGIGSVRSYEWIPIGTEDRVPGAIVSNFIKGPAFRRVSNRHALEYSRYVFAKETRQPFVKSAVIKDGILELIGAEDLEDVVAIYLQLTERCVLFPSTFKKGTKGVEGYGVSANDNTLVGWSVKSGNDSVDEGRFAAFQGRAYGLQLKPWPDTPAKPPCIRLFPEDVRRFLLDPRHKQLMPMKIQNWIEYVHS